MTNLETMTLPELAYRIREAIERRSQSRDDWIESTL
jgi:hypothetical protein